MGRGHVTALSPIIKQGRAPPPVQVYMESNRSYLYLALH